jgi:hypothetical protein
MNTRVYRFDPLDRAVLFGRTRNELIAIAVGGTAWLASTITRAAPLPGLVVLAGCVAVSLAPAGRGSVVGWWPTWFGWFVRDRRHRRWYRPLHLATATGDMRPELPPWLAGLSIISHPGGGAGIADRSAGTLTRVMSCSGRGFRLRTDSEIDWLLSGWGKVFDTPATGVPPAQISWSLISRPSRPVDHARWTDGRGGIEYNDYLDGFTGADHQIIVTVTIVAGKNTDVGWQQSFDRLTAATATVTAALVDAGLDHTMCGASEIARLVRDGLDPTTTIGAACGSLVHRLGLIPVREAGPMFTELTADRVRVDGAVHRTFWVASWPEQAQHADWFTTITAGELDGALQRIVTVIIEPITAARAMAEVGRDITRHGADAAAAAEGRGRIDARARVKAIAAYGRDEELAAGYTAVAYAGFVTVTATTDIGLDEACAAVVNRFGRARVELRQLWGRMGQALAAGLPLGCGIARTEPG